jgi:putative oxidoreductase
MEDTTLIVEHRRMGIALLVVRIAAAVVFLFHGSQILFGWFRGTGIGGFSTMAHVPVPLAFLAGLAEFGGGLAMLTGLLTRLGALGIMAVMLVAIVKVHLSHGFSVTEGGVEYALTQFLIAAAVLVAGAGPYSLAYPLRMAKPSRSERPSAPAGTARTA